MFRLKEIRKECGLKRSELSRKLNINAGTIANYENEIREAPYETLIMFANFFEVSVDYLIGRTEDEKPMVDFKETINYEQRKLLEEFNKLDKTGKSRVLEYIELWNQTNK